MLESLGASMQGRPAELLEKTQHDGYLDSLLYCHLCPCNYAPGLWTLGDISDICALIAPWPLFVENGSDGIAGPSRQVEKE